jgi:hypothetical protein
MSIMLHNFGLNSQKMFLKDILKHKVCLKYQQNNMVDLLNSNLKHNFKLMD